MKQFLKFTFASILGVFISAAGIIGLLFLFISIFAKIPQKKVVEINNNSVLLIKLDKEIVERVTENSFYEAFDFQSNIGLNDILASIKNAQRDANIKGILMDLNNINNLNYASIDEIREALTEFKKSGKFICSYAEEYTQKAYYLSTVSNSIYLNPQGIVEFKGLNAQIAFYKNALSKLEIDIQVIRHGKYKSAVEPFLLDKMSDENRKQTSEYIYSIWAHILNNISLDRKIDVLALNETADSLRIRTAKDALTLKFVDKLCYKDELHKEIQTKLNNKNSAPNYVDINTYRQYIKKNIEVKSENEIAVIYAVGDIVSGEGDANSIGSDYFARVIKEVRENNNIKAVVLRVNSPGGSALASEVIWREIILTKAVKPVVASFGDVAASGGYYISCGANKIICDNNTITGSIGVFGLIPNIKGLLNNKLGVNIESVKTNAHSDVGNITRPLTPNEKNIVQEGIENIYGTFIKHVSDGRNIPVNMVDSIGQGRIWSGSDAKRIGLVDELGGINEAISIAAKLAKLNNYNVEDYPKSRNDLKYYFQELINNTKTKIIKEELGINYQHYKMLKQFENNNYFGELILPYTININ